MKLCRMFTRSMSTTGFIGLGQMGGPMAKNLIKAGHQLVVFDVMEESVKSLTNEGATAVATPRQVAESCSTIITMLPSTPHVKQVYTDYDGILAGIQPNTLLIDSSTIEPSASKEVALLAQEKQASMVDAPVSGGVNGAAAGTLTFMVGGTETAFNQAKSILEHMGKNIVHCGDASMGQVAKLCNNLALAVEMIAVSEAMNLGVKLGIDPKALAGIMNTSSSQCWSSSVYNPYPGILENGPSNNDYSGGFASKLMRKDLGLALDAAKSVEASVPLTASAYQLYNMIVAQGEGNKDFGVVLKFLQGLNKSAK